MNMNMKNEKTMLALVLVAALAMVSVAGVALASESDADTTTQEQSIGANTNITVGTDSYQFYASASLGSTAIVTLTIPEGQNYTGSIEFGTMFTGEYISMNSVSFSEAGGMIVTITVNGTTHAAAISVAAISGAEVTGTATIGAGTFTFANYEGDLVVGDTTFTFTNVLGTVDISVVDGTPTLVSTGIYADITAEPSNWNASKDYYASLTIDGTANVSSLVIGTATADNSRYVELIITDGSDVTIPKQGTDYKLEAADVFTLTTTGLVVSANQTGVLLDQYGVKVGTAVVTAAATVTVTVDTDKTIYASQEYVLVIGSVIDASSTPKYSMGTVSFTINSSNKMVPSFSTSGTITKMTESATFTVLSAKYTSASYNLVYAVDVTTEDVATINGAEATFGAAPTSGIDELFFIMSDKITGELIYCCGVVTAGVVQSSNIVDQVGTYTGNAAVNTASNNPSQNVLDVKALAKVTVAGTLTAVATNSGTTCGKITSAGAITVTGLLTLDGAASGIATAAGTINAAYYSTTVTTTSITTNYYTTIAKALAASNTVTTVGTLTILEDMTIAGADATKNTTFTVEGTIYIGKAAASAIVTVPVTAVDGIKTTLAFNSGNINVQNGQLVLTGVTTDKSPYKANVVSDVFISELGSYTDLATATTVVTSGEILLRNDVTISSDITIISGVTLNAKAFTITVNAGGALTINGALNSTTSIEVNEKSGTLAAGILTFNTSNVKFTTLTMDGVFNIGESAEITLAGITQTIAGTSTVAPIINVKGTLNLTGAIGSTYTFVNVSGTLNLKSGASLAGSVVFTVSGTMNNAVASITIVKLTLTGTFNATAATTVTELKATAGTVYANEAAISIGTLTATGASSVTSSENGSITISTSMTVGAAPKTFGASTNSAKIDVILGSSVFAIVYGTYSADNMIINKSTASGDTAYNTAYYLQANNNGTNVLYATYFAYAADVVITGKIAISAMTGYNAITAATAKWYDADGTLIALECVGAEGYDKVYGFITGNSVDMTFTYAEGITYVVDGVSVVPGTTHAYAFGAEHRLSIVINNGYTGTPVVNVTGISFDASTGMFYITVADDSASVTVTGVEVKEDPVVEKDNLVTILLIIITIVIVIMAIIIALKLMRS